MVTSRSTSDWVMSGLAMPEPPCASGAQRTPACARRYRKRRISLYRGRAAFAVGGPIVDNPSPGPYLCRTAQVAELVDALVSGTSG